jgi:hypothetical protein
MSQLASVMSFHLRLLACVLAGFGLLAKAHPLLDANLGYRSPFLGHPQVCKTHINIFKKSLLTTFKISWISILGRYIKNTSYQLGRLFKLFLMLMSLIQHSTVPILVTYVILPSILRNYGGSFLQAPSVWSGGITFSHNVASVSQLCYDHNVADRCISGRSPRHLCFVVDSSTPTGDRTRPVRPCLCTISGF